MTARAPSRGAHGHRVVRAIAVELATVDEILRWRAEAPLRIAGAGPDAGALFSEAEQAQALLSGAPDQWLSCALAIKRAIAKVLGNHELSENLSAVEVAVAPDGRWVPELKGRFDQKASAKGVREFAVTVDAPPPGPATATVVALGGG